MNRTWLFLLAGLILWAMHFFLLYGIGEFTSGGLRWRLLIIGLTAIALSVMGWLGWRLRHAAAVVDDFERWQVHVSMTLMLLSSIAILWQALPALLSR